MKTMKVTYIGADPLTEVTSVDEITNDGPTNGRMQECLSEREREIGEIFAAALGGESCSYLKEFEVNPRLTLQQVGGDSIAAIMIIAKLDERYGVKIELTEFYENASPQMLRRLLGKKLAQRSQGLSGDDGRRAGYDEGEI